MSELLLLVSVGAGGDSVGMVTAIEASGQRAAAPLRVFVTHVSRPLTRVTESHLCMRESACIMR